MTDSPTRFLITRPYRRFAEICRHSHNGKIIGLFYGKTGLGKTESAKHYASWHTIEPLLDKPTRTREIPASIVGCTTAFYTPDVTVTPKKLQSGLALLRNRFEDLVAQATYWHAPQSLEPHQHKHLKLLIIDEADRLKFASLELLRDLYDRSNLSILLIGSPGIDRRLKRSGYGQLHSRFNFAYEIQPLNTDEMRLFIAQKWLELKLPLTADDAVSSAIMAITDGSFRRLHRIFAEIERLQKLNCLPMITPDLIQMARRSLLLGNP